MGGALGFQIRFGKMKWTSCWEPYKNSIGLNEGGGRNKKGRRHNLWVAMDRNRRRRFLVLT